LDFVYTPTQVAGKRDKTMKLLEFLSRQDPSMAPGALRQQAEATFLKLQECWQAREYTPMKPLLMPDLFRDHSLQLRGMERQHEINVIAGVHIDRIDLVNVATRPRRTSGSYGLITGDGLRLLRGRSYEGLAAGRQGARSIPGVLDVFQFQDRAWLLRKSSRPGESDALKRQFLRAVHGCGRGPGLGPDAAKEGPAGPGWRAAGHQGNAHRAAWLKLPGPDRQAVESPVDAGETNAQSVPGS